MPEVSASTIHTKMNILLGTYYSSPIDIGLNQIIKNRVGFLKLHLKHPLKDELTLLRAECVFVVDFEGGKRVINKVEMSFVLVTKVRNLQLHIKGDILCNHIAYNMKVAMEAKNLTY